MKNMRNLLTWNFFLEWKTFVRRPFFAVSTIIMLTIGLSSATVGFGIFYGFFFRSLPYINSSSLVLIDQSTELSGEEGATVSPYIFKKIRQTITGTEDSGLWRFGGDTPAVVNSKLVSISFDNATPSFFSTLRTRTKIGKLLDTDAGHSGGPHEAIISYKFWLSAYSGKIDVLGSRILIKNVNYRIVGVLPKHFTFLGGNADVTIPLILPVGGIENYLTQSVMVIRMRHKKSISKLNIQLHELSKVVIAKTPPFFLKEVKGLQIRAKPLRSIFILDSGAGILPQSLEAIALMLLILSIVNSMNFFVLWLRQRSHEFLLRRTLGATRSDIFLLIVPNIFCIYFVIFLFSFLLSWTATNYITSTWPRLLSPPFQFSYGWPDIVFLASSSIFIFSITISALIWKIFSLEIKDVFSVAPQLTYSKSVKRANKLVVVFQVSLSFILLNSGMMLLINIHQFLTRPLEFSPQNRIVITVIGRENTDLQLVMPHVLKVVLTQRWVHSASYVAFTSIPFSLGQNFLPVKGEAPTARLRKFRIVLAGGNLMGTMGIGMSQGRALLNTDNIEKRKVAVIDDLAATKLFHSQKVIGSFIEIIPLGVFRVIGESKDLVWSSHASQNEIGTIYIPVNTIPKNIFPIHQMDIIVHQKGNHRPSQAVIRSLLDNNFPGLVVSRIHTYKQNIMYFLAFRILSAVFISGLALQALIVAGLGIYGITVSMAHSRLREFGIRAVVGASPRGLFFLLFSENFVLLILGFLIGVVPSIIVLKTISQLLFHWKREVLPVFLSDILIIGGGQCLATLYPAVDIARCTVRRLLDEF